MTSAVDAAQRSLSTQLQRRLYLFLIGDAIAFALGALVCLLLYLQWVRSGFFLVQSGYTAAFAVVVAAALVPARAGRQEQAVTWLCTANWLAAIGGAWLTPEIGPVMTLAAQMPVLFALPYVSRARLRLLLALTVLSLVGVGVLTRVQDVTGIDKRIPDSIATAILVGCVSGMAVIMLAIAWQSYAALSHVNDALRSTSSSLADQAVELAQSRARVVAATDEARRRIERDLHDGAQQQLATLAVKLDLAGRALSEHPRTAVIVGELTDQLRTAIGQVRDLAHGIYPPLLAGGGLTEALPEAVAHATLPCSADLGPMPRYHADIEAAVYFCCLEALTNAAKHAGRDASISLCARGDHERIHVTITDTGTGFLPAAMPGGTGLSNMQDRVSIIGGTVTIDSEPGRGTRVTVDVPHPAPPAPARAES